MDLAELKFVVDTTDLESAAKRVAELGTAVNKLNKPMQDLSKESAKTNKELSKAEEAAAKAALAQTKLEQAQSKSAQAAAKSSSVLERQNLILEYMAQGNSKGQASILATAKAAGALDDEMLQLNKTLVTQRTLIGGDPFDKSIGLMQKLQNEYKTTTEVTALFNRNLGLTQKQMTDLAREKERLIALYGIEGKSLNGLTAEYDQLIQKSVKINQANDARTNSMKAQVKAQDDTTKANAYLATEMERVNRLTQSGGEITSTVNNKLIKFEQALRNSGQTAAQQVAALEKYKASLLSIQKAGGNRQIDYLSRALGPQITDIAVGLATGQAPLTILLQQGGQLRDQFALAGVAGADMGKMLIQASKSMVSSVKDVGVAVGQVFVGAITGSGKTITNFGMQITGASALLDVFNAKLIATAGANSLLVRSFAMLGIAINVLTGTIVFAAIAAFVMYLVSINNVIKEENALNRALNLTGAALGLNVNTAYDAAKSMNAFGISTGSALTVLTEMAKIGGLSSSSLQMIATTANALKTAFDIPISETVKKFKELQEKPTDSLTKLATQLGTIPVEILKQVDAYERAGKSLQAAELAMKTYEEAGKKAADRTIEEFGAITKLGIAIGKVWDKTWESIMGLGRRATPTDELKKAYENLSFLRNQRGANNENSDVGRRIAATVGLIDELETQLAVEKQLKDLEAKNAADAEKFADDKKKRDEAAKKAASDRLKAENEYATLIENANKFYQTQVGAVENLTKSEIALNKVKESKEYKSRSAEQQKEIDKIYEAAKANELVVKAEKDKADQMAVINSLMGQSNGLGKEYYNNLKQIDNALLDGNISLMQYAELLNLLYQTTPDAQKLRAENERVVKTRNELVEAGAKQVDNAKLATKALLEESELYDYKLTLIGKEEREVERLLGQKKIQIQYEKEIARIKSLNLLSGSKEDLELEAYKQFLLKRENLDKEANLKAANNLQSGISDSIVTALFEGGKAGSKKLRDLIVAELKRPITVVVKAVVDNLFGNVIRSATGSGPDSGMLSTLKSGYDLLTTGVSASIATSFGKLASTSFGQSIGLTTQVSDPVSASGQAATQFTPMGQNISAGLGMAGNALAGYGIQKAISGGYKTGESGIVDAITVAASAYFGPIAGVIAGVFNRAFGRKLVDSGVKGTFGGTEGFQGENFTFEKGGFFRSNRERGSALNAGTQSAFSMQFKSLQVQNALMADSLGQSTESIANFTKDIRLSFQGLTEEQIAKKIQDEFTAINESLAQLALGTTEYTRNGETAAQALTRLSTSLLTANEAIKHWGVTIYDVSLAGADAASTFVDLFGGIEGFSQAMGFFYENFFSDTEKTANLTKDLTTAFGKLGEELPSTREAFRALVVAAKEAGDDQQVKNLLDLQQAFAQLVPITEMVVGVVDVLTETMKGLLKERANLEVELLQVQDRTDEANAALRRIATEGFTEAEIAAYDFNQSLRTQIQSYKDAKTAAEDLAKTTSQATDDAYAALQRSVNAEKNRIDLEINALKVREDVARESVNSLNSLFELLSKNVKDLYSEVGSTSAMQFSTARALITTSLATARTTGYLPDTEEFSNAIDTVRNQLQRNQYTSKVDSERDRLLLAIELDGLQKITAVQLSTEEKTLLAIEDQIKTLNDQKITLDGILVSAKEQIDVMRGVNTSIISLTSAMANLGTAISAEAAAKAAITSAAASATTNNTSKASSTGYTLVKTATGATLNFPGGGSHSVAGPEGAKLLTDTYGLVSGANGGLIRTRADGGYTPPGMTLVGEQGPELVNFNRPGMVYTAAQSASLMGGLSSSEELAAIRQELVMLRAETRAVVGNTSKAAKILDRSSPDGQSLQVTVVTP